MRPEIQPEKIKRILLVRTDRIGDVVATTPVFPAVKKCFPDAYLAILVGKENADLVEGNSFLDEVILYDKKGAEKSILGTYRFACALRKKNFDAAVHFHPRARTNWISFLARIPVRIGYRSKNHWLLTHSIADRKKEGLRHEAEYNFDLLRPLSVAPQGELLAQVPLQDKYRALVEERLSGIGRFIVYHPSASSPSKIWPAQYFAELADYLSRKFQAASVVIGGDQDSKQGARMIELMKSKALNLCGKLALGELAWIFRKSELLVSNDSGPAHIAAAVGTPVVSIFGRSLAGLGPKRWRPLGAKSWYLQKDVGCAVCLADLCQIKFKCLTELAPREVIELIEENQQEIFHRAAAR